jgi:RNA ligase
LQRNVDVPASIPLTELAPTPENRQRTSEEPMIEDPSNLPLARTHPARRIPYDELVARLVEARDRRLVYERRSSDDLLLYVYTERCGYDRAWDETTVLARGLILDRVERRVVATPFPKFFNLGGARRAGARSPLRCIREARR